VTEDFVVKGVQVAGRVHETDIGCGVGYHDTIRWSLAILNEKAC
jgi:hypothetical protein